MSLITDHKAKWAKHKAKPTIKTAKTNAQNSTEVTDQLPITANSQYKVHRAAVKMDYDHLKTIPDHADRDKLKPALLDKYRDYLTKWMADEETHQNDVLFLNMIWAGDCQQDQWMMELTDYAVKTEQVMQLMQWKRDPATTSADTIFIRAEALNKQRQVVPVPFHQIFEKIHDETWQVNNILKARYYKLSGILEMQSENWETALGYLIQADETYENVGVKKRIKEMQKRVNGSLAAASSQDGEKENA